MSPRTLIELFEVPPGDDEAFLAAWRHERPGGAALFRALREDVPVRFVGLAPSMSRDAYELVHEDGAPEGPGGVVLIEPLDLDAAAVRAYFATRRGYLGTRVYRRDAPEPRVIHFTRWSSPLMVFRAVRDPAFPALAEPAAFPARPALYQRVPE